MHAYLCSVLVTQGKSWSSVRVLPKSVALELNSGCEQDCKIADGNQIPRGLGDKISRPPIRWTVQLGRCGGPPAHAGTGASVQRSRSHASCRWGTVRVWGPPIAIALEALGFGYFAISKSRAVLEPDRAERGAHPPHMGGLSFAISKSRAVVEPGRRRWIAHQPSMDCRGPAVGGLHANQPSLDCRPTVGGLQTDRRRIAEDHPCSVDCRPTVGGLHQRPGLGWIGDRPPVAQSETGCNPDLPRSGVCDINHLIGAGGPHRCLRPLT